jgi:hypothetical protein
MKPNHLTAAIGAACLTLMLALMWNGGSGPVALTLVALGAGLMIGACALADLLLSGSSTS